MENSYSTVVGTVLSVGQKETFSEKFSKVTLELKTDGQYPQELAIDFANKSIDKVEGVTHGDRVSIKYEVRGRRATSGKIYISLSGFMLTKI